MKHLRLIFALLLWPVFATHSPAQTGEVRVMTYNVRYGTAPDGANHWDKRKESLLAAIRAFDPDLLGTQEVLAFQRDVLAAGLPGLTPWGAGREDGKEAGEMTLLFYRADRFEKVDGGFFWYSETPDVPGSRSWDAMFPRLAAWVRLRDRQAPDRPPLLFLTTHLDHPGRQARLESARLLRARIAALRQGGPAILTGDFNAGEGGEPYQATFAPDAGGSILLQDAFRLAHPQRSPDEGTFSGFKASATGGARIDWIGATADWNVLACDIDRTARDGRTPSDHFAVTARLARP